MQFPLDAAASPITHCTTVWISPQQTSLLLQLMGKRDASGGDFTLQFLSPNNNTAEQDELIQLGERCQIKQTKRVT